MPGLDGLETKAQWRVDAKNLDSACMIAALTANSSPAEKKRVCQAGMNEYLSKPATMGQLAELIDLATQFQLERDIPLLPQSVSPKPMLDLTYHQLSKKIK